MTELSYMGANLVAQQVGWEMTDWMQGEDAANAYYEPIDTFGDRFGAFVALAVDSGFRRLDVWTAQLHWRWATPEHLELAKAALAAADVTVTSYAGLYGDTLEEFTRACWVATELGAPILGGNTSLLVSDRPGLIRVLQETGRRLAIENHPEKTPDELLERIGTDGGGLIGAAVDTGWWGTQGYSAADAIRELGEHVFYVHMKDIRAAGAHETCALGDGIVPVQDCVRAMFEINYSAPIAIEHEPEHYDPAAEVEISRVRLLSWLKDARVLA